jgi:hypothetical protein
MQTATIITTIAPFALDDTGHPADTLEGASGVTRFLAEVAPYLTDAHGRYLGLSEQGAFGLQLILEALDKTLEAAVSGL